MVSDNWRPQVDALGWQQNLEKRLMNEERRPVISSASDLLGPGAAPFAVETNDWNDEACTFVGVFYSLPNEVQNSPDNTRGWIGETFGVEDGTGFQRLTLYDPIGPAPGFEKYERRFVTASGTVLYAAWERTDIGAITIPEPVQAGVVSTGSYTTPDSWQKVANVSFSPSFSGAVAVTVNNTTNWGGNPSSSSALWVKAENVSPSGFDIAIKSNTTRSPQAVHWIAALRTD